MRGLHSFSVLAAAILSRGLPGAVAADLSIDSRDDIIETASVLAKDLMSLYHGDEPGNTPGILQEPYYFYQAGVFMGAFVDYFRRTGDKTYNEIVERGVLFQTGKDDNFMPANQTKSLGNDDQCYWALAAMSAAEADFPDPPKGEPQWLDLAKAVYDNQVERIDDTCGGGLRWQIFSFNAGYDYKNSMKLLQTCKDR
jgi:mannan endo-1,6-alpha-mannosidase